MNGRSTIRLLPAVEAAAVAAAVEVAAVPPAAAVDTVFSNIGKGRARNGARPCGSEIIGLAIL